MTRVAAIGLDAAEWGELQRLMAAGRMPNLARHRAQSIELSLRNNVVGQPEEAWTAFLYGEEPNRSGYWSNLTFDPATYRSYRQGAFDSVPFYTAPGRRSLSFDVPKQTIRPDVPGVVITGWGAHAPLFPRASAPTGLLSEVDRRFGPHPAYLNDFQNCWYQDEYIDGLSERTIDGASARAEATRWLLVEHPEWDVFLTALSEPHAAGHHLWHGVDPDHPLASTPTAELAGRRMTEVHTAVDGAIGRILEGLPADATVVIFSLHGMQPNQSDIASFLLLPELLHRLDGRRPRLVGPDHAAWANRGFPPVLPDPRRRPLAFALDHLDDDLRRRVRRRLTGGPLMDLDRALRRATGRPPGNRRRWVEAEDVPGEKDLSVPGGGRFEEEATDYPSLWYRTQWATMRAFALPSFGEGRIRVNLVGRERDGIVPLEDYEATCREIERELRRTIDPRTGERAAQDVVWTRRHDPMDPMATDADLVVTWRSSVDALAHPDLGTIGPMPYMRTSEHSNNGFALVSAPGVERAVLDVLPAPALPAMLNELLTEPGVPSPEGLLRAADPVC